MPTGTYHDNASTALTNAYVYFGFGTACKTYDILNDELAGGDNIEVSRDGVNQTKSLKPGEKYSYPPDNSYVFGVYLKSTPAGALYRLEAEPSG